MVATALSLMLLAASPDLAEGRVAFAGLKYAKAVEVLTRACADTTSTPIERLEAWELLARSHLALGQGDKAQRAWAELLELNPLAAEPGGAPKVRTSFQQAKHAKFPPKFVQLRRSSAAVDVLELDVVNPWGLALTLELWEASGGEFERRTLALTSTRVVSALKPGSRNYVRAVAADGVLLASLGSAAEPLPGPAALQSDTPRVEVTTTVTPVVTPHPEPIVTRPVASKPVWALVVAGAGVVAMVVGAVLLGLGLNNDAQAKGWPLNSLTLSQYQAAADAAPGQIVSGGIIGGVGLALALFGGGVYLFAPSN